MQPGLFVPRSRCSSTDQRARQDALEVQSVEFMPIELAANETVVPGVALSRDGHPTDLGLTRPALHDVLSDGCAAQCVSPRFGVTFEKLEQSDDKVTVTFTDGKVADYDFVIGADGLFSKVRSELFGDKYTPTFTGQAVWRYNLPRPADVIRTAMYQGVSGGKAGYCPLTDETMYLLLVMAEPGKPWLAKEDLPRLFKERLAPFGGRIGQIRDTTEFDADQIVYRPLEAVFVSEPWYRGRILLIGDAAHGTTPHLGQGAAQAVEDAATLGAIAEENLPVAEMFERFMAKRYARCKFIWESSIQIGTWEMTNDPDADVEALSHKVLETVSAPL